MCSLWLCLAFAGLFFGVFMPSFGVVSSDSLATCHPDLQKIFNRVITFVDCSIFCGHRCEVDQNKAFNAKLSEKVWPDSKHNKVPSMAVDAGPYFVELKNTDWDDDKAFSKFAGIVHIVATQMYMAGEITHHVRWGGDWDGDGRTNDQHFNDLPHFELIA